VSPCHVRGLTKTEISLNNLRAFVSQAHVRFRDTFHWIILGDYSQQLSGVVICTLIVASGESELSRPIAGKQMRSVSINLHSKCGEQNNSIQKQVFRMFGYNPVYERSQIETPNMRVERLRYQ
jgi:hypothetical protein